MVAKHEGRPLVSTFEGPTNSDVSQWATIRSKIVGGIYFVPDWTSQGPGFRMDLYDGAFSWDMWPDGPNNMTTKPDEAWQSALKRANKTYMMGKVFGLRHGSHFYESANGTKVSRLGSIPIFRHTTKPGRGQGIGCGMSDGNRRCRFSRTLCKL